MAILIERHAQQIVGVPLPLRPAGAPWHATERCVPAGSHGARWPRHPDVRLRQQFALPFREAIRAPRSLIL